MSGLRLLPSMNRFPSSRARSGRALLAMRKSEASCCEHLQHFIMPTSFLAPDILLFMSSKDNGKF